MIYDNSKINAVIMAAGTSSRFAPLSRERPKALIEVRGEVLIERQIRQLMEAGVKDVTVVTGYMGGQFGYLKDKFGVRLINNPDYLTRNNNSTVNAARGLLGDTYLCSSDNYFTENPFLDPPDGAYYAAVYADGETGEWCMTEDGEGYINSVTVGGRDAWYMLGHAFWTKEFSARFLEILDGIYDLPETAGLLWETIYARNLDSLKMKMRKYPDGFIFEFDTLDELRSFDTSYLDDTRSSILKSIAARLGCREADIVGVVSYKRENASAAGIRFRVNGKAYEYDYETQTEKEIRQ
ncbi:MAG: NTP transferase domain-containing protein [Clostridia bacterium]|nr:NTP transferase domain-containing protein [Clostridia bacterium]